MVVVVLCASASASSCKKLSELTASPDASVPAHDRVFGDLRTNVPEDVTEKEFSGALELWRRPLPQNRTNPRPPTDWCFAMLRTAAHR